MPTLPLVWSDFMMIALRADAPVATMRFYSFLGDHAVEASRIQVSTEHIKRMIDVLARTVKYYPNQPAEDPK